MQVLQIDHCLLYKSRELDIVFLLLHELAPIDSHIVFQSVLIGCLVFEMQLYISWRRTDSSRNRYQQQLDKFWRCNVTARWVVLKTGIKANKISAKLTANWWYGIRPSYRNISQFRRVLSISTMWLAVALEIKSLPVKIPQGKIRPQYTKGFIISSIHMIWFTVKQRAGRSYYLSSTSHIQIWCCKSE